MSWLTIIMLIIQYGPAIYKLIKQIIDLIWKVQAHMPMTEANTFGFSQHERLEAAIKYYKRTKDKSRLEEMHGELTVQLSNLEKR